MTWYECGWRPKTLRLKNCLVIAQTPSPETWVWGLEGVEGAPWWENQRLNKAWEKAKEVVSGWFSKGDKHLRGKKRCKQESCHRSQGKRVIADESGLQRKTCFLEETWKIPSPHLKSLNTVHRFSNTRDHFPINILVTQFLCLPRNWVLVEQWILEEFKISVPLLIPYRYRWVNEVHSQVTDL